MGSKDMATAFDRLEARVLGEDAPFPPDRISLRDHVVEIEIGAFQSERGTTQRVSFDVVVEVTGSEGALDDDVDAILSYDTLTEAIAIELAAERLNLLETLAERIADRILQARQATCVFLRIQKLDRGPGALGVEIVRSTPSIAAPVEANSYLATAILVVLDEAKLASPHLTGWLEQLHQSKRPLVIMVAPRFAMTPDVGVAAPQRRVDLLAYEQAAWGLAARDKQCIVMDSRTELEHAAKTGLVSVWAPSKMVLDATAPPQGETRNSIALAKWFLQETGVTDWVQIGGAQADANLGYDAGASAELTFKFLV